MNNARFFAIGDFDTATRSFVVIASTRDAVPATYWDDEKQGHAERIESLESWDLTRFLKNPLILAVHDDKQIASIIGKASEIQVTDRGLEMRITLLPLYEEPATDAIERKIRGGSLRGVSVGFTYGTERKELRDGQEVSVFTDNALNEVSVVPIPADQNALVDTEETRAAKVAEAQRAQRGLGYIDPSADDQKRKARSEAGKLLRGDRQPKLDGDEILTFDAYGTLGKVERTQVGGIRVRARLTRTGVLNYRKPDGTISRQLRLPDEVFSADSIASLRDVPVTDAVHHRDLISAHNFRDANLGHVTEPRAAGRYVEATLVVNDAETADAIERGELSDISCGYTCKHDHTEGVFDGEPYDLVHRNIRYNHVALLAPGKGRAGPEVRIQLDSNEAMCLDKDNHMAAPQDQKVFIKLDGKDYEYGSTSHIEKLDSLHAADVAKVRGELTSLKSMHEQLQGKFDAAEAEVTTAKEAAEKGAKSFKDQLKSAVSSRVKLLRKALRFATEEEGEGDEEGEDDEGKAEKKMDALDELSDRDIMVKCLNGTEAFREVKFDGKSDDYVLGIFEHASRAIKASGRGGVDDVVHAHRKVSLDSYDSDVKEAQERQREQDKNPPWKRPLQMSRSKG